MDNNIKAAILKALAGATSQKPVGIDTLYKCGARKKVESTLLEMYRRQEVCCCLITKYSVQKSVWWPLGMAGAPHSYGKTDRGAAA